MENFLRAVPVRRKLMLKEAKKHCAKIKHLLQSYALARPSVRLSLRILKPKAGENNDRNNDWIYACRPGTDKNSAVRDAAMQIIGRECVNQCIWTTSQFEGYDAQALLPKSDADFKKVMGYGQFLSVDSRPIRASGETVKGVVTAFREMLRQHYGVEEVRYPFLCLNLICPRGSYDPSREPMKDNIAFEKPHVIMELVQRLFLNVYSSPFETATAAKDANQSEELIQPCESKQSQSELNAFPFLSYSSRGANSGDNGFNCSGHNSEVNAKKPTRDQSNSPGNDYEDNVLTPDKSDLNPWILAKLHSSLGERKIRADTQTPHLKRRKVNEAAKENAGRTYGSNLEHNSFLPTPLPSSPLSQQVSPHRQLRTQKIDYPIVFSPISSTAWQRTTPQPTVNSKVSRQQSRVIKNNLYTGKVKRNSFLEVQSPKPFLTKPYVSPSPRQGLQSTPSSERQGLETFSNNNMKEVLPYSNPPVCRYAGESYAKSDMDRHNRSEGSPLQRELESHWPKSSTPPPTVGGGVVLDIPNDQNYSSRVISSIHTSVVAIERSLLVFGDIVYDAPAATGSSLLGSHAVSHASWDAFTRGDIKQYAKTLTILLSDSGVTVHADKLLRFIEKAILCD